MTLVDDVNAFDEREHLRLLEGLDCPLLFASATPQELRSFLDRVGAYGNQITMRGMPFDVLPTTSIRCPACGENPRRSNSRARKSSFASHLERKSRIFVIARTRGDVPKLAARLEETYGIPVQQLRGDMADSAEHRKRHRRNGVAVFGTATRIEMMQAFTESVPSILAATNLSAAGSIFRRPT